MSSTWVPTGSSVGGPRRSACATSSGSATRWCRSRDAARPYGPGGACAPCPRVSRSGSRPGSGPRPAPVSSGFGASSASPATPSSPGPTSGARSATAPSDRWWRASSGSGSSTRWSTRSSAASTPGRWTTCPPPRSIRRSWLRRSAGAASCAPSGAEMPAPDPDGPPLFWSLDGGMAALVRTLVTKLGERGVDIRLSAPADRLERAGAGWSVWSGGGAFRGRRSGVGRAHAGHGRPAATA